MKRFEWVNLALESNGATRSVLLALVLGAAETSPPQQAGSSSAAGRSSCPQGPGGAFHRTTRAGRDLTDLFSSRSAPKPPVRGERLRNNSPKAADDKQQQALSTIIAAAPDLMATFPSGSFPARRCFPPARAVLCVRRCSRASFPAGRAGRSLLSGQWASAITWRRSLLRD